MITPKRRIGIIVQFYKLGCEKDVRLRKSLDHIRCIQCGAAGHPPIVLFVKRREWPIAGTAWGGYVCTIGTVPDISQDVGRPFCVGANQVSLLKEVRYTIF